MISHVQQSTVKTGIANALGMISHLRLEFPATLFPGTLLFPKISRVNLSAQKPLSTGLVYAEKGYLYSVLLGLGY